MANKEQITEDDDNQHEEDVEIVVGEDPEKDEDEGQESKTPAKKEAKSDEDAQPDEPADDDESDEDEEKLREKRRKEKIARKERREKAIARDKVEMNFLRQRNEELEKRMMAQEMRSHRQDHYSVEQQIAEQEQRARTAEQVLAKAIAESNGDDAAAALKYRDEALDKIRELTLNRNKLEKEKEDLAKPAKQQVDPQISAHAQEWIARNPWYDPNGRDLDSKIVLAIDQSLVDEGYAPRTAQYWKELDKRVRARLPHQYEQDSFDDEDEPVSRPKTSRSTKGESEESDYGDEDDRAPSRARKGPPLGQPRESVGSNAKKREIYISPERKEALIQAGVWDDPVLRMRYVKRYKAWDKENASR